MPYRIGADIGGTFTDLVISGDDGTFEIVKVLTTPRQPDDAVLEGVRRALAEAAVTPAALDHLVHGTTLFTNALIERKGARTALVTTKGFRDAVEIGREHRYDMYDLHMRKPEPLAPRHLRFDVDERVLADGSVRKPLDEADVAALVPRLRDAGVEAVAVSLLHAYANPVHEQRLGALLRDALPDVALTLSSDLVPEIREYERASTTLSNVYVKRIAERYLGRLQRRLGDEVGAAGELFVMQSNGGVCAADTAIEQPIRLVESGPAAGALAAAHYGSLMGHADLLSFDMGGTTAKACVIADGRPLVTTEFEVDRQYQFKKGSGLPVKVAVLEMIEIGTGGGSIARVDALGRLRVGPESAGAEPGPVAYGRGGTEPTVTDADVVLGYLDPAFFLGGTMALDAAAAEAAIGERVGRALGLDAVEAAFGIHQLANETMASAARIHAIERGKDVAKFPVFAFGGAGPVHAFAIARILKSPRVIYPLGAGVASAIGLLAAPLALDFVRSLPGRLDALDWARVAEVVGAMEDEGRSVLARTVDADEITCERFCDMRYAKQGYEVRVPVPAGPIDASCRAALLASFEAVYRSLYGHAMEGSAVEVVSWRVVARGPEPALALPGSGAGAGDAASAMKGTRRVFLTDGRRFADVPVYDRYRLAAGARFEGPAVVEERESTVVVNGPAQITVDRHGSLVVDLTH